MTITVYKSTDTSAPSLSGTAGTLIAVLDACLVNGYGSKTAAGWGKAFTGTNKAVYRPASGSRLYLRVDDTTLAKDARMQGYETMSDVDTGTNAFPTAGQISGGGYWFKSNTTDAVVRPWMVIADDRAVWLLTYPADTVLPTGLATVSVAVMLGLFGDIKSYKTGDAYHTAVLCNSSVAATSNFNFGGFMSANNAWAATPGHYIARSFIGASGSTPVSKAAYRPSPQSSTSSYCGNNDAATYPNPITGGMDMTPIAVAESASGKWAIRGQYPGMYEPQHNAPGSHGDTFTGTGDLAGIQFMIIKITYNNQTCTAILQTSGTWY